MEPSAKTVRVKRMSEECLQNLQMQVNFDPKYSTAKTMSLQFMHDMHGSMHEQLCMLCKTVTKLKKRGWPPSSRFNNMYIVDMFFACFIHHIIIRYYRCICYVCIVYLQLLAWTLCEASSNGKSWCEGYAEAPRQGELLLNIRATIPATETIRSLHYEIHVINSDVQHIYYDHELYTIVLIVWSMHI